MEHADARVQAFVVRLAVTEPIGFHHPDDYEVQMLFPHRILLYNLY
jgi:hypothetical protein